MAICASRSVTQRKPAYSAHGRSRLPPRRVRSAIASTSFGAALEVSLASARLASKSVASRALTRSATSTVQVCCMGCATKSTDSTVAAPQIVARTCRSVLVDLSAASNPRVSAFLPCASAFRRRRAAASAGAPRGFAVRWVTKR